MLTFLEAIMPAVMVGAVFGYMIVRFALLNVRHIYALIVAICGCTAWAVYHLGLAGSEIYFGAVVFLIANYVAGAIGCYVGVLVRTSMRPDVFIGSRMK